MKNVYQLKITLEYTAPPVWRRVQVPADIRLDKLHDVIQTVMGWTDSHLHVFRVGAENYGMGGEAMPDMCDEHKAGLGDLADQGDRFLYEYDFGDGWLHTIEVEQILPAESGARYPRCLAGERACPPEDCGGPPGYQELLETLDDPDHPEYDEMLEWAGEDFDPEAFDLKATDAALTSIKR